MTTETGYALTDLAALAAIPASERVDGFMNLVKSGYSNLPDLYAYSADSTDVADGNLIIMPDDNPVQGRHHKLSAGNVVANNAINWTLTTPTANNIVSLDIYYSSSAEYQIHASPDVILFDSKIGNFIANTDYTPGGTIDLSNLVQANGPGVYFFVYKLQDNSLQDEVRAFATTIQPKGAARTTDSKHLVIIEDISSDAQNVQSNAGLIVVQSFATASVKAEQLIIN